MGTAFPKRIHPVTPLCPIPGSSFPEQGSSIRAGAAGVPRLHGCRKELCHEYRGWQLPACWPASLQALEQHTALPGQCLGTGWTGKGQLGKAGQLGVASLFTTPSVRDMAGCWPAKSHPWFWIGSLFQFWF